MAINRNTTLGIIAGLLTLLVWAGLFIYYGVPSGITSGIYVLVAGLHASVVCALVSDFDVDFLRGKKNIIEASYPTGLTAEKKKEYRALASCTECAGHRPTAGEYAQLAQATLILLNEVDRLEGMCLTVFYGDRVPVVRAGLPAHELEEILTAKQVTGFITQIERTEGSMYATDRDCVHPPGCTSCSWCGFKVES